MWRVLPRHSRLIDFFHDIAHPLAPPSCTRAIYITEFNVERPKDMGMKKPRKLLEETTWQAHRVAGQWPFCIPLCYRTFPLIFPKCGHGFKKDQRTNHRVVSYSYSSWIGGAVTSWHRPSRSPGKTGFSLPSYIYVSIFLPCHCGFHFPFPTFTSPFSTTSRWKPFPFYLLGFNIYTIFCCTKRRLRLGFSTSTLYKRDSHLYYVNARSQRCFFISPPNLIPVEWWRTWWVDFPRRYREPSHFLRY